MNYSPKFPENKLPLMICPKEIQPQKTQKGIKFYNAVVDNFLTNSPLEILNDIQKRLRQSDEEFNSATTPIPNLNKLNNKARQALLASSNLLRIIERVHNTGDELRLI